MATLADIPIGLLEPLMRGTFLDWVNELPVDRIEKLRIIRIYRQFTNVTLTVEDYNRGGVERE